MTSTTRSGAAARRRGGAAATSPSARFPGDAPVAAAALAPAVFFAAQVDDLDDLDDLNDLECVASAPPPLHIRIRIRPHPAQHAP